MTSPFVSLWTSQSVTSCASFGPHQPSGLATTSCDLRTNGDLTIDTCTTHINRPAMLATRCCERLAKKKRMSGRFSTGVIPLPHDQRLCTASDAARYALIIL